MYTNEQICRVLHHTLSAFCVAIGEPALQPWDEAPEWQKESTRDAVRAHLEAHRNGDPTPSAKKSHEIWAQEKRNAGWTWGPVKDAVRKTHPDLVPYEQLSFNARFKDPLVAGVIRMMADAENLV